MRMTAAAEDEEPMYRLMADYLDDLEEIIEGPRFQKEEAPSHALRCEACPG